MATPTPPSTAPQGWWMYHGDPAHSGCVPAGASTIDSGNVATLKHLHDLELGGPVLGAPALVDGFVYAGTANSKLAQGGNGGAFYKVDVAAGTVAARFCWDIPLDERDSHGFTGMGCTPAVTGGFVYFSAFNGKVYCLSASDLSVAWITDLRYADPVHNQPVSNVAGNDQEPVAAGWASPLVVNGRVYVGMGEGENPELFGFIYCLDAATGDVDWIFCTNQFVAGTDNTPNQLPASAVPNPPAPGSRFTLVQGEPVSRGCSIWSSIAYDQALGRVYATIGNPMPEPLFNAAGQPLDALPRDGYGYGILSLDATSGEFRGFWQIPLESSYRVSDIDIDFAGSPMLFDHPSGKRAVAAGNKNGGLFVLDADTLQPFSNAGQNPAVSWRQLLPFDSVTGAQIPTVDAHDGSGQLNPQVTNEASNALQQENFYGTYSTPAWHPSGALYIGMGGSNDNLVAPGIDYQTTPFMRAVSASTLADLWATEPAQVQNVGGTNTVARYVAQVNGKPGPGSYMYQNPSECALSLPVVVNDVVLCATTAVSLYAFKADDGTALWMDQLGQQTLGLNGGYGFCFGPAVWGTYVVAGALVNGRDGGLLRIYSL
ncbi:PQQ-binding-like beta-propeller repeat protein [Longimicrobium sp.]|uniref:outer membrane protein assembly factor BamB family protein n=1 Tax=Longimicrobium sp. TaxID=2029185 RepID=UPI002E371A21|nr:PQQ-binding-like beta-propeller repeat protein [Longimicrobium sp.]HEX6039504.1 PQQ-binding-like beta-propeller repeat protein [Longimicrobium sp.]